MLANVSVGSDSSFLPFHAKEIFVQLNKGFFEIIIGCVIIFAMVISYIFNRNEKSYEQQTTKSCFEIEHEENLKMAY